MTFSAGGSGLWLPRRLGLGAAPGPLPLSPDGGLVGAGRAAAQGYIPKDAAGSALDQYRQATGALPWAPTDASQIGPWAKQQAANFASAEIRQGISDGAYVLEAQMSGVVDGKLQKIEASLFPPMGEDDIGDWATAYVQKNGFPKTVDDGMAMARAFVNANCDQIGLPPEFIAAASLVQHFPDSTEAAEKWAVSLGSAYLSRYGITIVNGTDLSSFLQASARTAIAQVAPGVPFQFFEATFGALKDGSLTSSEVKGLVIGAAGFIGGVIGQAFGIPAPIGALLSQLIVGEIVSELSDAFGWGPSDSEKLNAAQKAAGQAMGAASAACNTLATALWLEYQIYWDSIETNLGGVIRNNAEWLYPSGSCGQKDGIRLFPGWTPYSNVIDYVRNEDGTLVLGKDGKPVPYPYYVNRYCGDPAGCPYVAFGGTVVRRASYGLSPKDLGAPPDVHSSATGCDALSALSFWGSQRYVSPNQVLYAMKGAPLQYVKDCSNLPQSQFESRNARPIACDLQPDAYYLKEVIGKAVYADAAGTQLAPCGASEWASFMFRSLQQAAAAMALVQRDITRTVSTVSTAYGMQYHLNQLAGVQWQLASDATRRAATNAAVARAAAYRHAILESRRRGYRKADFLNYGLLAAGGGAIAGLAASRMMRKR